MTKEQNESSINIKRGKCDSLNIYEVTEWELEIIKRGSPNSIFLNFSIALLSLAISFLTTLITVNIESDRIFYIFVILCTIGFIVWIILLILWIIAENDFKKTIKKIEERIWNEEKEDISDNNESIILK